MPSRPTSADTPAARPRPTSRSTRCCTSSATSSGWSTRWTPTGRWSSATTGGAPVAWHTALLRPDRVRGVVGLSVPYLPRGSRPPLDVLAERLGPGYYQLYFQEPGRADAELARDPRATFRRLLSATGGGRVPTDGVVPDGGGFLDLLPEPDALPGWLTEADLDAYVAEYADAPGRGFTGGLNWYRNLHRNWELTAPWRGAVITPPAMFLAGDQDLVVAGPAGRLVDALERNVADLRRRELLAGCGHWTQQERPAEVSAALVEFVHAL